MTEAEFVWIDQGMIESSVRAGGTVEIDLCEVGIVVLDHEGRVTLTDARARELLRAESQPALNERVRDLCGASRSRLTRRARL